MSPKMPPRFSFNIDFTSSVNIPLNSITFAAMVQTLQTDKCAHCFTKSFWMIIIKVEWRAPRLKLGHLSKVCFVELASFKVPLLLLVIESGKTPSP